jgi:hypothetical protein
MKSLGSIFKGFGGVIQICIYQYRDLWKIKESLKHMRLRSIRIWWVCYQLWMQSNLLITRMKAWLYFIMLPLTKIYKWFKWWLTCLTSKKLLMIPLMMYHNPHIMYIVRLDSTVVGNSQERFVNCEDTLWAGSLIAKAKERRCHCSSSSSSLERCAYPRFCLKTQADYISWSCKWRSNSANIYWCRDGHQLI